MNCADACDLLSEKLTGDLDAFRLAAVDEHLAGCPACRREMQELASLLASLNEGAEPLALVADPGPRYWDNFAGRVRTTLAARREERERRGIFAWFTLSRFAVAMSVLLIGTLDAFFAERIFKPRDLVDTGYYVAADKVDRLSLNYGPERNGGNRDVQ